LCTVEGWLESAGLARSPLRAAFLDVDEYLVTREGRPLGEAFHENDPKPSWAFRWRTFGTSGHERQPSTGSVLTNFVQTVPACAYDDADGQAATSWHWRVEACNTKFPSRTDLLASVPYRCKSVCDLEWLLENKGYAGETPHYCVPLAEIESLSTLEDLDVAWINHYNTKVPIA
jgi:hypothetical protein